MQILQICLPHVLDVTILRDYLRYLRRKLTIIHLPTPPETVTTPTCELQNFFI